MVISWTGLNLFSHCYPLYSYYKEHKEALIETKNMKYGRERHETIEANVLLKIPKNLAEAEIIRLADDWQDEYEFFKDINVDGQVITLHGFFDLFSPKQNIAVEYKTGGYNPLQLEFYSLVADVYIYPPKQGLQLFSRQVPAPQGKLLELFRELLNGVKHYELNELCSLCKIAHTCPLPQERIKENDIDAIGLYIDNLNTRIENLKERFREKLLEENEIEGKFYTAKFAEYEVYKIKKQYKDNIIDIVLQNNLIDAIELNNKVVATKMPHLFDKEIRKRLIIQKQEKEVEENE